MEWLDGFHEVLDLPCATFMVDDEWEDDIGLVHNQRVVQSGQSWQQGSCRAELAGYSRLF